MMNRSGRFTGILLSILLLTSSCTGFFSSREDTYVVVVSFDGFRWDYPEMYNTPHFDRLEASGVRAERLIPSFPTKTFPNHYTLATGLHPDNHGLINNTFYDAELDYIYRMSDRGAVENGAFYDGEPMWVTASNQGVVTGAFYWVGSEAPVKGVQPTYWKRFDDSVPFAERIDSVVKWLDYPEDKRPRLINLYYEEPDGTGHGYGPASQQTGAMVQHVDSLLGVLVSRLNGLPVADKINLIVLSDHGMAEITPERYVDLTTVIPEERINRSLGGNPIYNIDVDDEYIDDALSAFRTTEGVSAWHRDSVPEHLHYGSNSRIPTLVVLADSGWSIGMRPNGSSYTGGTHGWDPRNSDMQSIFYATGPAFRQGYRDGVLYNVDIYNMVMAILGLDPAPNDGDPSRVEQYIDSNNIVERLRGYSLAEDLHLILH